PLGFLPWEIFKNHFRILSITEICRSVDRRQKKSVAAMSERLLILSPRPRFRREGTRQESIRSPGRCGETNASGECARKRGFSFDVAVGHPPHPAEAATFSLQGRRANTKGPSASYWPSIPPSTSGGAGSYRSG